MSERELERTIEAVPEKEILNPLNSDLNFVEAVEELIDNSIDGARRSNQDNLTINVEYDSEYNDSEGRLIIEDNGGGVQESQLEKLVILADSITREHNRSIGAFGIGFLRSVTRLGKNVEIETRAKGGGTKIITITPEWWEKDNWEFDVFTPNEETIEEGRTRITITDLNFDEEENTEDDEEIITFSDSIYQKVADTYTRLLQDEEGNGLDLEVVINGESVVPSENIDWSYSPFGVYPRRYSNIELPVGEGETKVYLTITVGLMRTGSEAEVGTDVYCQDRKVVSNSTEHDGFFGDTKENFIGEYSNNRRFRMIVEFNSESSKNIPWKSNKSELDTGEESYRKAKDIIKRIAKPYNDVRYKIPEEFITPFDDSHPQAYNGGEVVEMDRFSYDRVDKKFSEADLERLISVKEAADRQAEFGVIDYSILDNIREGDKDSQREALKQYILSELDEDIDEERVIEGEIPAHQEPNKEAIRGRARDDVDSGEYSAKFIERQEWYRPLYESYLSKELDEQSVEEFKNPPNSEDEHEADGTETEDVKSEDEEVKKPSDTQDEIKEIDDEVLEDEEESDETEDETEVVQSEEIDISEKETEYNEITVQVPTYKYNDLIRALGLDPNDVDEREVEDKLSNSIEDIVDISNH